ncbi:MAG: type III-B CRISPR-associated protein Cas10/Cmr2 [Lysobacteraceae bacterium]|nr:MAG: type III-B CRISPR-associated protein Cas10/Cmr2 [Xanthomonadaceae bacterium]
MSHHLIEISFGPVQSFIAAARRSRDLWAGSRFLSEVVRAAARQLLKDGATLIYPTAATVDKDQGSNLSNVILARVQEVDAARVAKLVAAAQQAGRERLKELAEEERQEWKRVAPALREALWNQQVAGALESYSAWSAWDGTDEGYRASYDALKTAFAQRKNTRDFAPAPALSREDAGLPKSSLDGANESVLPRDRPLEMVRRMGISDGEQLDALGCMKRSFGRREDFTALPRLAADPWLRQLAAHAPPELEALNRAYEPLVALGLATRCEGNEGAYRDFPYDAGLLFGGSLATARQRAHDEDERRALNALAEVLGRIGSQPCPYVALMMADGDRMGVFVDRCRNPTQHAAVSDAIAGFANQVPALARAHHGHAIYNGGEDLMVAFPLDTVVEAACALSRAFDAAVGGLVEELIVRPGLRREGVPTLRAGVAICHVTEPMGYIRECAERAEKFAKGDAGSASQGHALGLRLHIRAGHEVALRLPFSDQAGFEALARWTEAFAQGELPSRVAYDTRSIGLTMQRMHRDGCGDEQGPLSPVLLEIADTEFRRVLDRAQERGGRKPVAAALADALAARAAALGSYVRLGDELVLARWLSARAKADLPERLGS